MKRFLTALCALVAVGLLVPGSVAAGPAVVANGGGNGTFDTTLNSAGLPSQGDYGDSVLKLAVSQNVALNGDLALALEGATAMLLHGDAPYGGFWQQQFLNQWGTRIGGGTEQVQRNVIGERVLGLPPEPRPDKRVAFRELVRS